MKKPNRDATNPPDDNPEPPSRGAAEPPPPASPVPPSNCAPVPRSHTEPPSRGAAEPPRFPNPSIPHPGIFNQPSCRVPDLTGANRPPVPTWVALRRLTDRYHGVRWVVDVAPDERSATLRKVDEDLRFELSIDLTRPDTPYATLVRHTVADADLADRIREILHPIPFHSRRDIGIPLRIGYGHDTDPCDPDARLNFQLSILNRWNPPPLVADEHRIAQFFLWNVDVLLWLRAQAAVLRR